MKNIHISISSIIFLLLLSILAMPAETFAVSSITVGKASTPAGLSGFQFTFVGPGNNTPFTLSDGGSRLFSDLAPGTYTVTEVDLPAGVELFNIQTNNPCGNSTVTEDEADYKATIVLGDNCDLSVNFINVANTSITINKVTIPADNEQEFDFTSNVPGLGNFTITSAAGTTVLRVPPGTYTVQEQLTNGFTLTNIVCDDPGSSTNIPARTATIDLDADENIICTFTNNSNGMILIEKETVPEGGEGFKFTEDITAENGTFTLNDGQIRVFNSVAPGEYKVTEEDPAIDPGEFFLSDIVCDDIGTTTDLETRTATIDMDLNEVITCKFTNTTLLQGLKIVKTDFPDPVVAGQELTYDINIINEADTDATEVLLVDELPDGVIPVDIFSDDEGVDCGFDVVQPIEPQTASCDIGTLLPDEEVDITIIVIPDPDVFDDAPVIMENKATLTAEPGSAVREATTQTLVNPIVELEINPNRERREVHRREFFDVFYDITVNPLNGAVLNSLESSDPALRADALNVLLDVEFSDLFEVVSVESSQGQCTIGSVNCNLGNILEGQTVRVTINFRAPDERGEFDIIATVTSLGQVFTDRVVVNVSSGGDGNCSLAAPGSTAGFPLYLFIPLFILLRRSLRRTEGN